MEARDRRATIAEATAERRTCCGLPARSPLGNESTKCCSAAVGDMMNMLLSGSGQGTVEQHRVWDFRANEGRHGKLEVHRRDWAGKAGYWEAKEPTSGPKGRENVTRVWRKARYPWQQERP